MIIKEVVKIKKQSLLKGTFILALAGFLNKVLGFLLRMVLVRIIGDEGLGLFQMVFPLFVSFSIITTLGLPVALSKFIPALAVNKKEGKALKLFFSALILTLICSFLITITFVKSSSWLATSILQDERTYQILLFIAPALIFTGLASILRGFFQGFRLMTPTAISRVAEQLFRIVVTLVILHKVTEYSLGIQAAGVALGITIGEFFGFLTLLAFFFYYYSDFKSVRFSFAQGKQLSFKLIKFGLPITIGRLIASLMYTVEAATIPSILQAVGYSISQATSFYGQLAGMVQQLIYLPTIITISLNTNLVPNISELMARKNYRQIQYKTENIIKLISYIGFLTTAIFLTLGQEICELLFNYPQAGQPLRILALTAIFLYLGQSFSGILQGMGKPQQVVINLVIALALELLLIQLIIYFPAQFAFTIITAAIGIRHLITAILHFRSINKVVKIRLFYSEILVKPLLALIMIVMLLPKLYKTFHYISESNLISLLVSISFASLFFLAFLILTNGLRESDIKKFLPQRFSN